LISSESSFLICGPHQASFAEAYFYFLQFAISLLLGNSHSSAAVAALPRSLVQSIVFSLAMIVGECFQQGVLRL
jgi:hypothetical protein